ncbi:uncharacterized protein FIBRA_01895 [Fibroporia radiculosa]|uniref:Uncharacterized protein n=1 Tax=Fibroporia radiculosa TaxID=599839 RepID=J4GLQ7_9APHY|nr:uncharacterized protein FIBRA_01895 [Fibroporia radiculosa]CCL99870.1 predicted protein [Fibroporia radiculosa]
MSLPSGAYIINSLGSPGGSYLARESGDTLLPKKVFVLPPGTEAPTWVVTQLDNGRYKLETGDGSAGVIDGKVYAIGVLESREQWILTYQDLQGAYTVERASQEEGWVAPDGIGPDAQLESRPLIVMPSEPPQYLPSELFIFSPVEQ